MNLTDILKIDVIHKDKFKIHFASGSKKGFNSLDHFYSNTFKKYQERQTKKVFEREFIISLIKYGTNEWLFAGVYKKKSIGKEIFDGEEIHRYDTELTETKKELIGELILEFHKKDRNAYRLLEKLDEGYKVLSTIISIQSEEEFQAETQKGKLIRFKSDPIKRKDKTIINSSNAWSRDKNISYTAIFNANFECENNSRHNTFISARTGEQYVEAHHLIPMKFQNDFTYSLDVPENIISLCPNCHRAFHLSDIITKEGLILKFFQERKSKLIERRIAIGDDKLLNYYKTTPNTV